jgi:hypothetical protein
LNKYTTATIANVKPSIQSLLTKKIISNINFSVSYKINVTTNAYPTDAGLLNATTSSIINHVTLKQNKNNIYQLASTFNFDKRINGVSSYFKNNEKYKHNIDVIYKNSRFDLHFFTQPKFLDSIVISSINNDNKLISSTSVINNTSVQFEIIYFNGNVIVNDVVVNSKYNVSRSENFNFMNLYDKKTLDFILTPNSNSSSYEV